MNEKTKTVLLMVGTLVLVAVFLMFGGGKFMDPAKWIDKFAVWGLPAWFVSVSGALELAGAVGLLIPVLRGPAGLGLAMFMVGAVATHIIHAEIMMIFVAGAILVGSAVVGWLRLPETMAFIKGRTAPRVDSSILINRITCFVPEVMITRAGSVSVIWRPGNGRWTT